MTKYFAALLITSFVAWPSFAADRNGYTAQHECRAGSSGCNIDLTPPSCDVFISVSDSNWSKIYSNTGAKSYCIEPGDHTSKGVITLNFSGTSSQRKWIRSTTNQNPATQSVGARSTVKQIFFNGGQYWVIDQLALNGLGSSDPGLWFKAGSNSDNNIVNRSLIENAGARYTGVVYIDVGSDYNTIQNSVIRNSQFVRDEDNDCVQLGNVTGTRIVNNEIYNCKGKGVFSPSGSPIPGTVVENNDIYVDVSQQSDCSGNIVAGGPCSGGESPVYFKSGGILGNPVSVIHNRLWGPRWTDLNLCCGGGSSGAVVGLARGTESPQDAGADYVLIQNNVIMDGQLGVHSYPDGPDHISVIGNIFYKIRQYYKNEVTAAMQLYTATNVEWIFNTVVDSDVWLLLSSSAKSNDIRCNVAIASGSQTGQASFDTTIVDNVAYTNANDAKGTQYCFWRKLHTGPEQVCIPYVRPTSASPHLQKCTSPRGSNTNIGIGGAFNF